MLLENSIGTKIKSLREEKGFSQNEVVEKLSEKDIHISRETLSKIENDNRTISAIELNAVCSVLNVDISTLFSESKSEDDLVTLFRKRGSFSEKTIEQIDKLQDMIKIFISQERIYKREYQPKKREPLWEECLN